MKKATELDVERRKLLKWMGGSVALLSVSGLTACSDGGSEPPATARKPEPAPEPQAAAKPAPKPPAQAEPPVQEAAEPVAQMPQEPASPPATEPAPANGEMPKLAESNPQAQALGYKADSSSVDAGRFPNHAADQVCANCTLFAGEAGQDWGPCGIFPGNQVNSSGWCSAWNRKA